ncbi:hypothetical protein RUMOBE_03491 [Blautia obeum ATCC 29174]|uniref:Uncharacterized protein n=1 Tax=Blautia obeum ATCC 29174 TaxID=411459 RepID=A5ZWU7_9FIRM|nr:hypothetical protein RUMOBE_03491 [Blautia obeum ATCC 29174]
MKRTIKEKEIITKKKVIIKKSSNDRLWLCWFCISW